MVVETGTIQSGAIALDRPLPLQDGQKVVVRIEELPAIPIAPLPFNRAEFLSQPFFGQWGDRADPGNSEDSIRKEREKWSQRLTRPD
jgi:hypothetical protein